MSANISNEIIKYELTRVLGKLFRTKFICLSVIDSHFWNIIRIEINETVAKVMRQLKSLIWPIH